MIYSNAEQIDFCITFFPIMESLHGNNVYETTAECCFHFFFS